MPSRSCGQCANCLLRQKCLRVPRVIPAQGADRPPRALRRAASAPPLRRSVEDAQEEDCGGCTACLDKPKFCGWNRLRKRCERRTRSAPQPSASSDPAPRATSAPAIQADCGACANCADMPKFGGPGKRSAEEGLHTEGRQRQQGCCAGWLRLMTACDHARRIPELASSASSPKTTTHQTNN